MPTGFRLVGASRDFVALEGLEEVLGNDQSRRAPQNAAAQNGVGDLKRIFTVWLSTLSILAMSRVLADRDRGGRRVQRRTPR